MGWDQLGDIARANRQALAAAAREIEEPTICPLCALPLMVRALDGAKACPLGHWMSADAMMPLPAETAVDALGSDPQGSGSSGGPVT